MSSSPTRARLVDYFVEVVADVLPAPRRREGVDDFERRVTFRLPATDHADFPLPDGVPFFCVPSCLSAATPSAFERKPTFFSFSLTGGDGARAYGFALHFYDALPGDAWRPRVFCLVSHHPFFSLFKEVVSWVFRQRTHSSEQRVVEAILADASGQRSWFVSPTRRDAKPYRPPPVDTALARAASDTTGTAGEHGQAPKPSGFHEEDLVDRVLAQFVLFGECPHPGGLLELRIDGRPFFSYHVHRGNVVHVDDYCFQVLFQCLSLKNALYIVNCMLLEQRILIHSNHHGLLTPVCEALCALLFPFVWEHVYVPFLPVKLVEYLQAPVPYIMGLHTSSLATKIGADIFSSCVVVHLDKDKVVTPISSRIDDSPVDFVLARLPSLEVDTLLRSVEHLVPQPVNSGSTSSHFASRGYHSTSKGNHSPVANKTHSHPSSPLQHVVESLNFCTSRPPTENELELTFGEGPLGITFESTHMRLLAVNHFQPGRQPGTSAVVKTLPRLQNGLPGPAERSGLIRAGSFLVAINGVSTLDLTFEETIDRLRVEKRPVRLRFLNASAPHESACRFAERLQSLSLVSALQIDHSNTLLRWVDAVRGAFAVLFTSIFRDFQRYILIEHIGPSPTAASPSASSKRAPPFARSPSAHAHTSLRRRRSSALAFSVTFDHVSFCEASTEFVGTEANSAIGFLREFTQTQSFVGFVNDSVMGRISHTTMYPQVELFHSCIHLYHEIGDPIAAAAAIALLFERDHSAIETLTLDLPRQDDEPVEAISVGQTLLSEAHAFLPESSRSPVRSPVKSPLASGLSASSSPCKRTSTTRQLEMIICGSLPDPVDPLSLDDIASSVEAALSASLDTELLKQLDDGPGTRETSCADSSPSRSSSSSFSSSKRTLTADHRSESLSSSGSASSRSVVDDEVANQALVQKAAGSKARQLDPEDAGEDPLLVCQR